MSLCRSVVLSKGAVVFLASAASNYEVCSKKLEVVLRLRRLDFAAPHCFSGEVFGIFLRVRGVLMRLSGQFMSGKMISFAVSGGGGNVGVGRKVVKFRGSIVSALWQCVPLSMVCLKTRTMSTKALVQKRAASDSYTGTADSDLDC
jgi:hypothetical protein